MTYIVLKAPLNSNQPTVQLPKRNTYICGYKCSNRTNHKVMQYNKQHHKFTFSTADIGYNLVCTLYHIWLPSFLCNHSRIVCHIL